MLIDMLNSFQSVASRIKNYEDMTKQELADGYCNMDEAGDIEMRDAYYSALIVRYWFKIYEYHKTSSWLGLDIEDYVFWLAEALDITFTYRRWRDPSHPLSKDPRGAVRVIDRTLETVRLRHFTYANKFVRKANYQTASIDEIDETIAEPAAYVDGLVDSTPLYSPEEELIMDYVDKKKLLEAIIFDGIAHQDTMIKRGKKEYFSIVKMRAFLRGLDNDYFEYFENSYDVPKNLLIMMAQKIKTISSSSLTSKIEETLMDSKTNPVVLDMLTA